MTGVIHPSHLYLKKFGGKITIHRYYDDEVVGRSRIPPHWKDKIPLWDNRITMAREYESKLKKIKLSKANNTKRRQD